MFLSPISTFSMNFTKYQENACTNSSCVTRITLKWKDSNDCHYNILCSRLNENRCGDYKIAVVGQNDSSETPICYPLQKFEGVLEKDQEIYIEETVLQSITFQAQCYAFCSKSGSLPNLQVDEGDDIVLALVRLLCKKNHTILH